MNIFTNNFKIENNSINKIDENVDIVENKIICLKSSNKTGIYKIFQVNPNSKYKIILENFNKHNSLPILWIKNMDDKVIFSTLLNSNTDFLNFKSTSESKINISIYFLNPRNNHYFTIDDIKLNMVIDTPSNSLSQINAESKVEQINAELKHEQTNVQDNSQKDTELKLKQNSNKVYNIKNINDIIDLTSSSSSSKQNIELEQNKESNKKQNIESKPQTQSNEESNTKQKQEIKNNTITVVIPCHYLHFNHLDNLLKILNAQSKLPNEVIIVLSEANKLKKDKINALKEKKFKYKLILHEINEISYAGNNRYIGSKKGSGNIIIFQDADDIPHKQRIELIDHVFLKYQNINHITHSYREEKDINNQKKYIKGKTEAIKIEFNIFNDHVLTDSYKITNGNIAIRKKIIDEIDWLKERKRGQDIGLNRIIFRKYKSFIHINVPLLYYRRRFTLRNKI